jgi:hypothetical protein
MLVAPVIAPVISPPVFNKYPDKSIVILFKISFLINGDIHVKIFCFVFKFDIVAYVEDAVDDNK